jgi:hypothetical protein
MILNNDAADIPMHADRSQSLQFELPTWPATNKARPQGSSYVGLHPEDTSPMACLLVVSMRRWAYAARAHICPTRLVAPGLILSGQTCLLAPFHHFMLTLATSAARPIGLAASEACLLRPDEALILGAFEALQAGDLALARAYLAPLTFADALLNLTHHAAQCAFAVDGPIDARAAHQGATSLSTNSLGTSSLGT